MTKDERKHMVHPLTYGEVSLQDGRVLVLKERLIVPLERRHDRGIVWYASNDELGLQSYSPDRHIVEKDIEDQIATLYKDCLEPAAPPAGNACKFAPRLKDMIKEIRNGPIERPY